MCILETKGDGTGKELGLITEYMYLFVNVWNTLY